MNPQVYCPDGLSAPLQVPPGFEASGCEGGSERCTRKSPCPKGTSCQKGLQTECAKGYFAERVGSTVCLPCAPGFYSDVVRATSCDGCPKGWQAPNEASIACSACKKGQYAPQPQSPNCLRCNSDNSQTATPVRLAGVEPGRAAPLEGRTTPCEICTPESALRSKDTPQLHALNVLPEASLQYQEANMYPMPAAEVSGFGRADPVQVVPAWMGFIERKPNMRKATGSNL